jgi:hypothetical protein
MMLDPRQHNYFKKLMQLYAEGKLTIGSTEVDVYHDNWCGVYRGRYCDCDPEIRLRQVGSLDPRRN